MFLSVDMEVDRYESIEIRVASGVTARRLWPC